MFYVNLHKKIKFYMLFFLQIVIFFEKYYISLPPNFCTHSFGFTTFQTL